MITTKYNYFHGMPHGGMGARVRHALTDFGSPWRGIMSMSKELAELITRGKNVAGLFTTSETLVSRTTTDLLGLKRLPGLSNELKQEIDKLYRGMRVAEKRGYAGTALIRSDIKEKYYQSWIERGVGKKIASILASRQFKGLIRHERTHAMDALRGVGVAQKSRAAMVSARMMQISSRFYGKESMKYLAGEALAHAAQYEHGLSYLTKGKPLNDITHEADIIWSKFLRKNKQFAAVRMNSEQILAENILPNTLRDQSIIERELAAAKKRMSASQHKTTVNGVAANLSGNRGSRRGNSGANG